MDEIVLNREQSEIIGRAPRPVAVRSQDGRFLGYLPQGTFTPEEIEEAKRALESDQPRYDTQELLARLRALKP